MSTDKIEKKINSKKIFKKKLESTQINNTNRVNKFHGIKINNSVNLP